MDWQTVSTSAVTSGLLAGAIGYALKRSFDRALDVHFERLKEQNKAAIQENLRRQSLVYDKQFDALRTITSLTYRSRNIIRDITQQRSLGDRRLFDRFRSYVDALTELLFEERAVLPQQIFALAHDLKHSLAMVLNYMEAFSYAEKKHDELSDAELDSIYGHVSRAYEEVDAICSILIRRTQAALGLEETGATRDAGVVL